MKLFRQYQILLLTGLLALASTVHSVEKFIPESQAAKPSFVEGEVLVKFKPGIEQARQQQIASAFGGKAMHSLGRKQQVMRVKVSAGQSVQQAIAAYQADPNVEYVQPNYIYYTTLSSNDSEYGQLWGLHNTGQPISNPVYDTNNPGSDGADIDAELAWDEITDCRSVVTAVLDSGIDYTQQDLANNMWVNINEIPNNGIDDDNNGDPGPPAIPYIDDIYGYDFIDNDGDPLPTGGAEHHGTHVAGTIGALGNNANGTTGVCWQAQIMAVRVVGGTGSGTTATISEGIRYAADNGAHVINMSLGSEIPFDTEFSNAISYARDRDVVVVVAAGNGGADGVGDNNDGSGDDGDPNTRFYPCNFTQDNLLCVAALDQAYSRATFSNYGATSVDLGAPGVNILSSYPGESNVDPLNNGWNNSGGWANVVCDYGAGLVPMLVNPVDWCSPLSNYAANADDRAYKVFNLNGVNAVAVSFASFIETQSNFDFFSSAFDVTGGDPFDGNNDTQLFSGSGSTLPSALLFNYDLPGCNTATCSIGFRLTSNNTNQLSGVGIPYFLLDTLELGVNKYELQMGTSMATPHVTGIATLVRANNPDYTYTDTVAAIKTGGEEISALNGITTTGMAANAMGALSHINPPSGINAVVQ